MSDTKQDDPPLRASHFIGIGALRSKNDTIQQCRCGCKRFAIRVEYCPGGESTEIACAKCGVAYGLPN